MKKQQLHQWIRFGDALNRGKRLHSYLLVALPDGLIFVLSRAILLPADGPM